ncbi:xanthine dehydrogenase accessory protein XdhC [Porticoccus sp. W117]|uniref:xanthine dehydrogenase accessory protein XdhC n=1 Tax=Porticoccus sp. W117 TaxID=3054777 RepID=UPI0025947940|nr:xanthine dehydrogenase accessory protein XdhC [Porticoccus sp. W117]MDM3872329.1 xanthine dehydrogenase accessory protein XdhC [Porticoccus sp. W117]
MSRLITDKQHWHNGVATLEQENSAYVLVTVLAVQGSTPRDNGTKMVISYGNEPETPRTWGTIGGGHLEYKAMSIAAELLAAGKPEQRLEHFPLGAKLGQCCGGRASLLFECFPGAQYTVALFGAGHVGRALIRVLGELPYRIYWVDSRDAEFPDVIPQNVTKVISDNPVDEISDMPSQTRYLIMTHRHSLDFDLAEAVLKRNDTDYVGLIGSDTKWRRFQSRFSHKGYAPNSYQTIRCPIGNSQVPGKEPMEVAVSIAAQLIADYHNQQNSVKQSTTKSIRWQELHQVASINENQKSHERAEVQVENHQ